MTLLAKLSCTSQTRQTKQVWNKACRTSFPFLHCSSMHLASFIWLPRRGTVLVIVAYMKGKKLYGIYISPRSPSICMNGAYTCHCKAVPVHNTILILPSLYHPYLTLSKLDTFACVGICSFFSPFLALLWVAITTSTCNNFLGGWGWRSPSSILIHMDLSLLFSPLLKKDKYFQLPCIRVNNKIRILVTYSLWIWTSWVSWLIRNKYGHYGYIAHHTGIYL